MGFVRFPQTRMEEEEEEEDESVRQDPHGGWKREKKERIRYSGALNQKLLVVLEPGLNGTWF